MDSGTREVELKFIVEPHGADDDELLLAWLARGAQVLTHNLRSIYFDTPGHALRRAGLSLRVRRDGRRWTQTLKTHSRGGGIGQGEWEGRVEGAAPDLILLRTTPAAAVLPRRLRLASVFSVEVKRHSVVIEAPGGVIEASLDRARVTGRGRSARFRELELELKSGSLVALFALAERLMEAFDATVSFVTKADRGFALVAARSSVARHFQAPALHGQVSAGEAFQAIARACLEQVAANASALRAAPEPEVIHQLRVGLRRLRAAIKGFKAVTGDARVTGLEGELRWLSAEMDGARNLDVFVEGALRRASRSATAPDAKAVRRRLRVARDEAYERARRAATSRRGRGAILQALAWSQVGPWTGEAAPGAACRDRPIAEFAAASLERQRRRLLKKGRRLGRLSREERHHVRIRAKALRYTADVFDRLWDAHPKRARRFLERLKALLEDLGDLNDIATAEALAADFPSAAALIGDQTGRETDLLGKAQEAFDALSEARRYWPNET